MKTSLTLFTSLLAAITLQAEESGPPNPPEVQALTKQFLSAFQSGDEAAMTACWHSPEVFAKVEVAEETAARGGTLSPEDAEKETKREISKREKDMATTLERATQLRALMSKHFGDLNKLELIELDLDLDDDAPADAPAYDSVDLHLRATDGTHLIIELDDVVKLEGAWKFKGRLDDHLKIQLPDED